MYVDFWQTESSVILLSQNCALKVTQEINFEKF